VVTQVIEGKKTFDVVLRFDDSAQKERSNIAQLPIQTLKGNYVPLNAIADIEEGKGPSAIQRENISRRIVIQANIAERDLVSTVKQIQKKIEENIHLPNGYFIQYDGQFEAQQSASRTIFWLSLLSLIGMFTALHIHFKSTVLAIQIMLVIPLALIGAVAGIHLTGGVLSVATMIGFVTLAGIAARNGIMMISHYLHLMKYENEKFDLQMLIRGTNERLVPVLMTALTAALALLPLVLAGNEPGKEILHPVAVVILSGLCSSTLLNLLVTPLIFWRFSRKTIGKLLPNALETAELKTPQTN